MNDADRKVIREALEDALNFNRNRHNMGKGVRSVRRLALFDRLEQALAILDKPEAAYTVERNGPENILGQKTITAISQTDHIVEPNKMVPESAGDARELAVKIEAECNTYEGLRLNETAALIQAFASRIRAETLEEAAKCKIEQEHIVHLNPNRRLKDVTEYNDGYTDGILSLRSAIRSLPHTPTAPAGNVLPELPEGCRISKLCNDVNGWHCRLTTKDSYLVESNSDIRDRLPNPRAAVLAAIEKMREKK